MYCQNSYFSSLGSNFTQPQTSNINEKCDYQKIYYSLPAHTQYVDDPYMLPPCPPPFITKQGYGNYEQIPHASHIQPFITLSPVNQWLSGRNLTGHVSVKRPHSKLNVTSIRKELMQCSSLMKEFEKLINLLQVFKRTLSEEDWVNRCKEIVAKELEISKFLQKFDNEEYFLAMKRVVNRCFKKRIYRKRKRKEWQEMKKMNKAVKEREHRRIDLWLEKMKDQVERAHRQEQIKREADLVLSEVTIKKAETKRFLNFFNILTKLRNTRLQQITSSGGFVSETETSSFAKVIEKLKKLWLDQLKENNMEEQGLRVMLNDAEVERVNVEAKVTRQIQKKWHEIFFGEETGKNKMAEPGDLNELINTRCEWDHYVTNNDNSSYSQIPIGWILPSGPSNSEWSKYLEK